MTHEETIRGMWSLLSLFEDFLWAKHDSFIYPLSEKNSIFSCNKKGLQWFLRLFQICEMSRDGSDTSHNACPSWTVEWMSTAEHRAGINTSELLNVIEILNLKHCIGKMWNKPGNFLPGDPHFKANLKAGWNYSKYQFWAKNPVLPLLLPEIFVLVHQHAEV